MGLRKGMTNNPFGRPKKPDCLSEILKIEMEKMIELNGRTKKIAIKKALVLKTLQMALEGDNVAMGRIWGYSDGLPKTHLSIEDEPKSIASLTLEELNEILKEKK